MEESFQSFDSKYYDEEIPKYSKFQSTATSKTHLNRNNENLSSQNQQTACPPNTPTINQTFNHHSPMENFPTICNQTTSQTGQSTFQTFLGTCPNMQRPMLFNEYQCNCGNQRLHQSSSSESFSSEDNPIQLKFNIKSVAHAAVIDVPNFANEIVSPATTLHTERLKPSDPNARKSDRIFEDDYYSCYSETSEIIETTNANVSNSKNHDNEQNFKDPSTDLEILQLLDKAIHLLKTRTMVVENERQTSGKSYGDPSHSIEMNVHSKEQETKVLEDPAHKVMDKQYSTSTTKHVPIISHKEHNNEEHESHLEVECTCSDTLKVCPRHEPAETSNNDQINLDNLRSMEPICRCSTKDQCPIHERKTQLELNTNESKLLEQHKIKHNENSNANLELNSRQHLNIDKEKVYETTPNIGEDLPLSLLNTEALSQSKNQDDEYSLEETKQIQYENKPDVNQTDENQKIDKSSSNEMKVFNSVKPLDLMKSPANQSMQQLDLKTKANGPFNEESSKMLYNSGSNYQEEFDEGFAFEKEKRIESRKNKIHKDEKIQEEEVKNEYMSLAAKPRFYPSVTEEFKYFVDSLIFDLDTMEHARRKSDTIKNLCMPKPGICSRQSFPVTIIEVQDLGTTSLYVKWTIHDCYGIAGYEIYVDGYLTNRYYHSRHEAAVVTDVDVTRPHKVALLAQPASMVDHSLAMLCDSRKSLPWKIKVEQNQENKETAFSLWTPSIYLYDPNDVKPFARLPVMTQPHVS